ncbi:MAG: thioredoxin family protein [Sphaerospermopsis kisseleviana]|uniref:Thioredoxin family protein n=2 Tax=Sphaerospermopsis TaxID=752201 RepID=A0ABT4ZRJ1_9CYAN|nr:MULTISPECIES: thioredoxin family protein [Sphaerospermopsis]MEB3148403.1 thioredoxin family protein [Sphaerospermopsis sp.]BAZ81911.1 thioredoxin domain-containing protein [Sphaerospermopsis kisseleviana NIES-73]MBC5794521.1 thioredoxin family protein [Sphaerospermopsis sp. LEGE 00249]MBD2132219.1 thioredoxin family protein [Sphaerospermopsis sp. FACHB-1094]MBD2144956.1 thioredoxin family protein [Sphaerospermopsis sp. FACHB-1194]
MVLSVSERTFTQEVLESPIPVLVNFEAPWCGLCRIIHPLLLQFQAQCDNGIKLVAVNADQNFKLSTTYRLKSLPTLLLIEKGVIRQRLEGFRSRDDLRQALEEIQLSCMTNHNTLSITTMPDLECRSA